MPKRSEFKASDKKLYIAEKQPGELRIISADIALMATSKHKNDATSIFINQMLKTSSGKYISHIVYPENNEGLRTDAQALNIRRLFHEYDCDYLVLDCKGLGLGVADAIMADMYDAATGETYGALSCCNNEDIAKRCLVKNAPKKIWAVHASAEFNSRCASVLREVLRQGGVRFLVNEYDGEDVLNQFAWYRNLSPADKINLQLPYINTTLLVQELVNLEFEVKNNVIKVKEKAGGRKDRYSSLSYNIFVAKELERELSAKQNVPMKELVLKFQAPKLR